MGRMVGDSLRQSAARQSSVTVPTCRISSLLRCSCRSGLGGTHTETEQCLAQIQQSNNIDSIGIEIIRIFHLLRRVPRIPKIEMITDKVKYFIESVWETWNVQRQVHWSYFHKQLKHPSFSDLSISQVPCCYAIRLVKGTLVVHYLFLVCYTLLP